MYPAKLSSQYTLRGGLGKEFSRGVLIKQDSGRSYQKRPLGFTGLLLREERVADPLAADGGSRAMAGVDRRFIGQGQ